MRRVMLAAVVSALASAVLLYILSYETRRLEARVRDRERAVETARAAIAVLRAERAHLARPGRIEPLVRALGLRPVAAARIVGSEAFAVHVLEARSGSIHADRQNPLAPTLSPSERGDSRVEASRLSSPLPAGERDRGFLQSGVENSGTAPNEPSPNDEAEDGSSDATPLGARRWESDPSAKR